MVHFETNIDLIIFIIEILGCISFASSGAIKGIRKKADILGVLILTVIEIFGGGILRDLVINQYPPKVFWDVEYLLLEAISLLIAIVWFVVAYFKKSAIFVELHRHDFWIYALDAIGIAVFCVCGVKIAANNLPDGVSALGTYVYIIILGVITGVGGGIFRDVFVGEIPTAFKKHFYITPCIIGTTVYAILYLNNVNTILSISVGIVIIVLLRLFAILFKWNLPSATGYNKLVEQEKK